MLADSNWQLSATSARPILIRCGLRGDVTENVGCTLVGDKVVPTWGLILLTMSESNSDEENTCLVDFQYVHHNHTSPGSWPASSARQLSPVFQAVAARVVLAMVISPAWAKRNHHTHTACVQCKGENTGPWEAASMKQAIPPQTRNHTSTDANAMEKVGRIGADSGAPPSPKTPTPKRLKPDRMGPLGSGSRCQDGQLDDPWAPRVGRSRPNPSLVPWNTYHRPRQHPQPLWP
uniref:Uncharacterized protein n=1 Tax=Eutreptiella gymnastica TaxID=73025 RepID=A0A7S1J8W0_9EUGL|mmetsp:Transcript_75990/g.134155  ORF Transcript_75990/g.134155 Transcript_75990/m.134155 type:complete len:233 (+) Transcript_75990:536-1234(+)